MLKYYLLKLILGRFSYTFQDYVAGSRRVSVANRNFMQPCSKMDALNHFRSVMSKDSILEFKTDKKIEFQNTPFNTSFRRIKNQKKKFSCYDTFNYQNYFWRRLGYRERIFNTGVRLIYHFIEKKFFFGEMFFSDVSKVDTNIVALSLLRKYTDQKSVPPQNFKITGKNAYIFYENTGINLSIKYISTEKEELNAILKSISDFSPFSKPVPVNDLEDLL